MSKSYLYDSEGNKVKIVPAKKKRRWWLIILVVIIIGAIASQGDKDSDVVANIPVSTQTNAVVHADSIRSTETTITETEPEALKIGVPAVHKDETITVLSVDYDLGSQFSKPDNDMQFAHVKIEIQNDGTKNLSVNPMKFEIKTSNGEIMKMDFKASVALSESGEKALSTMDLAGGGKTSGIVSFQVPAEDEGLTLLYMGNIFSSSPLLEIELTD